MVLHTLFTLQLSLGIFCCFISIILLLLYDTDAVDVNDITAPLQFITVIYFV